MLDIEKNRVYNIGGNRNLKKYILGESMKQAIKGFIFILGLFVLSGCRMYRHETEGRYLVECINAEKNRYQDSQNYFYTDDYSIYCYSLNTGEINTYVEVDFDKNEEIMGFEAAKDILFYVKRTDKEYELIKVNCRTGEENLLLSYEDIIRFNGGEEIEDTFFIRVYKEFILLATSDACVYICPMEGNIALESMHVNQLFEEDKSGKMQQAVYEGMTIERYYCKELSCYRVAGIRDDEGRNIVFSNTPSVTVDGRQICLYHDERREKYQYQAGGEERAYDIDALKKDDLQASKFVEEHLTVNDEKIVGWISISNHPLERNILYQENLEKDVLFELDIETGKSRILLDTKNNLTKIIGYQNGIVYLVKNEKVCALKLETKEETELFALPKGKNYIIDWQADYLIIREEFSYEQNGDIIAVYQL